MRIRRALPVALGLALFPLFGCATAINGSSQTIHVDTDPPGAAVTVLGVARKSPVDLVLPRKTREAEILIEMEGYVPKKIALTRSMSKNTWLNFIGVPVGGAAGAAIGGSGSKGLSEISDSATGLLIGAVALPSLMFAVDGATGAIHRLEPPFLAVKLERAAPVAAPSPTP